MIKNVSKNEVREYIKDFTEEHPMGWQLWQVGAFIHNDDVSFYTAYKGQGLNEVVYNEEYDEIVDLIDEIEDLQNGEQTLDDTVDIITDKVNEMIDEYNEGN